MWTDSSGRALSDYPRPSVAVDVALLTVTWTGRMGQLAVLLHQPTGGFAAGSWGLPGTFVREDELLADAALRALRAKVGVTGQAPQQLRVFDALDRDERGRVLSVAHLDVVPEQDLTATGTSWTLVPITAGRVRVQGQRRMPYDHDRIVTEAVSWVRSAYQRHPDPFALLGEEFTLSDLQKLHEAVAGHPLVKDTFRRGVAASLRRTERERSGTVGRPAALYRHQDARGV